MSNTLHFDGRTAKTPTLEQRGETKFVKLTLIRNEYIGRDSDGEAKTKTVRIQFTAFGKLAERIAKTVRTGDQLIVTAHVENNDYKSEDDGEMNYKFNFVMDEMTYGAPGKETSEILAKRHTD